MNCAGDQTHRADAAGSAGPPGPARRHHSRKTNNNMRNTEEIPEGEKLMLIGAAAGISTYIQLLEGMSPNQIMAVIKTIPASEDVLKEILEMAVNRHKKETREQENEEQRSEH
jgi:hypothetical protein